MALLHDSPPPLVISGRIPFSTKVPGRGLPRYVREGQRYVSFLRVTVISLRYGQSRRVIFDLPKQCPQRSAVVQNRGHVRQRRRQAFVIFVRLQKSV